MDEHTVVCIVESMKISTADVLPLLIFFLLEFCLRKLGHVFLMANYPHDKCTAQWS